MAMKTLILPARLATEFATVVAVWNSGGETRRVDALLLSWVKYEKQLRRLFSFLVFQHPKITEQRVDGIISVLVQNQKLHPESFIRGIQELGVSTVQDLVGPKYNELEREIQRIKSYRNKLMQGQITGKNIQSAQIERDVLFLVNWIALLAEAANALFGYDGVGRNTFRAAKATIQLSVTNYPFSTPAEFKAWLRRVVRKRGRPPIHQSGASRP
jgi:hypothetical protein